MAEAIIIEENVKVKDKISSWDRMRMQMKEKFLPIEFKQKLLQNFIV